MCIIAISFFVFVCLHFLAKILISNIILISKINSTGYHSKTNEDFYKEKLKDDTNRTVRLAAVGSVVSDVRFGC